MRRLIRKPTFGIGLKLAQTNASATHPPVLDRVGSAWPRRLAVSELSFEERINEVLDKRLRDQTTLPAEFRSWLPKFIEIQDIRLPMSQVSGLYLTGGDGRSVLAVTFTAGSGWSALVGRLRMTSSRSRSTRSMTSGFPTRSLYWTSSRTYTGTTCTTYYRIAPTDLVLALGSATTRPV